MADNALEIDEDHVRLHLENVGEIDNGTFGGPGQTFSLVNIDITWSPFGEVQHFRPGSLVPTDPTNFSGNFRFANAAAILSGSQNGFSFSSTDASSVGVFAEVGKERNGVFLDDNDDVDAGEQPLSLLGQPAIVSQSAATANTNKPLKFALLEGRDPVRVSH